MFAATTPSIAVSIARIGATFESAEAIQATFLDRIESRRSIFLSDICPPPQSTELRSAGIGS
jgi:hypothetical protein